MRAYHDEFDSLFIDSKEGDGVIAGPNTDFWLCENRPIVFLALRDYVKRREARDATNAALNEARAAIDAAQKAFTGKFE